MNGKVYIGCMTGTSVDANADFTAARFDDSGQLLSQQHHAITLPSELRRQLLTLSQAQPEQITTAERNQAEGALTDFLIDAYREVITVLGLTELDKAEIILSPHGQTIAHCPNHTPPYTDQIIDGARLAKALGYTVVVEHRQAAIQISQAAPLAPVLLRRCFQAEDQHTLVINGGGIANLCCLAAGGGSVLAWDTGPANGILDTLLQNVIEHAPARIPEDCRAVVMAHGFDVDGRLAARGKVLPAVRDALLQHEYFQRPRARKSAERSEFPLAWVETAVALTTTDICDVLATVVEVIAMTIATECQQALSEVAPNMPVRCLVYGGIVHHQRIISRLQDFLGLAITDLRALGFDPDFMESLLMAQLGCDVDQARVVDLAYCQRDGIVDARVLPGRKIVS